MKGKRAVLKSRNLKKDNSETDLDGQPDPVQTTRSPNPNMRGGGRAILVYTWLRSVANDIIYIIFWDLQKGFINKGFIKRCSKGDSFDVEFVLDHWDP